MFRASRLRIAVIVVLLVGLAGAALAQRRFFGRQRAREVEVVNQPYDGRFTFARVKYQTAPGGFWYQGLPSWSHGYPMSEDNLMRIMNEVSYLGARTDAYNVFAFDDPEVAKYPITYLTEAGWWTLTDREVEAFRAYLLKGGFVIFDDFAEERGGWMPFVAQMNRVIPGARWVALDGTHPIFHSFFEIPEPLKFLPPYEEQEPPVYYGLFEDNDPDKRLMAIVNFNNDISEYWEYSGQGFAPVPEENEAYKLGVNYVIYGLTH